MGVATSPEIASEVEHGVFGGDRAQINETGPLQTVQSDSVNEMGQMPTCIDSVNINPW